MKKSVIFSIIMILSLTSYLIISAFIENQISNIEIKDIVTNPNKWVGKTIKVQGKYIENSLKFMTENGKNIYKFKISGEDKSSITIYYEGVLPDNITKDNLILTSGKLVDKDSLIAKEVLTKCPSKYDKKGDKHPDSIKRGR